MIQFRAETRSSESLFVIPQSLRHRLHKHDSMSKRPRTRSYCSSGCLTKIWTLRVATHVIGVLLVKLHASPLGLRFYIQHTTPGWCIPHTYAWKADKKSPRLEDSSPTGSRGQALFQKALEISALWIAHPTSEWTPEYDLHHSFLPLD